MFTPLVLPSRTLTCITPTKMKIFQLLSPQFVPHPQTVHLNSTISY